MSDSLASLRLGDTHAYFAFDEEPSKDITCAVCLEPWQHPVEITPCGHIFCEACVPPPRSRSETQKCPMCRAEVQAKAPPNRALSNIIAGLATSCTRCEWKGEYAQFQRHDCPAGDEHKLPRRTPTASTTTPSRTGRTTATTTTAEDVPLLVNGGGAADANAGAQQRQREERSRRMLGKLVLIFASLAIIIPLALYIRNLDHHDDNDQPLSPPPSHTPRHIVTPSPVPPSPYECPQHTCNKQTCQSGRAGSGIPWRFQCTASAYPSVVGTCSESAAIPKCSQTCNTYTCMWWRQCPDEICNARKRLPICSSSKPIRCYIGPANGTCSDEPDISFCSQFCDIRTCS